MIVNVKLKSGTFLNIVGGYKEDNKPAYTHGLSLFLDGKYILNFVISPAEVELLVSSVKIKAVEDLGFHFIADDYGMTMMKYFGTLHEIPKSDFCERGERAGETDMRTYSIIKVENENLGSILEGLKLAMSNPEIGENIYTELPRIEEVTI